MLFPFILFCGRPLHNGCSRILQVACRRNPVKCAYPGWRLMRTRPATSEVFPVSRQASITIVFVTANVHGQGRPSRRHVQRCVVWHWWTRVVATDTGHRSGVRAIPGAPAFLSARDHIPTRLAADSLSLIYPTAGSRCRMTPPVRTAFKHAVPAISRRHRAFAGSLEEHRAAATASA